MTSIFEKAGVKWSFIDKEGGVCCGRPLMLSGQDREARELINYNSSLIRNSGARILVTSCPICFKVFRESYYLDLEILHHSQYIKRLIGNGLLKLNFRPRNIAYHTPCELGRGSGVFDEPKEIIKHVASLLTTKYDDENSLCCGGSLGNIRLSSSKKAVIARETATLLTEGNPEILATACPLCKKTLAAQTNVRVADIAEIVADAIPVEPLPWNGNKSRKRKEVARPITL
jgi:Fe-S oxidoreductase